MEIPKKAYGLEFTLAIGCPLDCHYCPQKKLISGYVERFGRDKLYMTFEDFRTILSKLTPGSGIAIGGMVEPFKNRECAKMVKYAYEQGFLISFDTTLMGMTEEDFELIKNVQFVHLQLHIPDEEGNAHFKITDDYLHLLKKVTEQFCITGYSCHGHVHPRVSELINPEIAMFTKMINRAGNLDYGELDTYQNKGMITCGSGSNEITGWACDVLPNGTVILCCMDYGMEHILGNLLEQEWDEIISGDEFQKIEKGMYDDSISILCRQCSAAQPVQAFPKANLLGANAIRTNRILQKFAGGGLDLEQFENRYGNHKANIVRQLMGNKNVCIFGCGKLFKDNYFNSSWNYLICAKYITDNRLIDGNDYGLIYVKPEHLNEIDNLLVVIYVIDSEQIKIQLEDMGITNYIDIMEVYDLFYMIDL